MPEPDSGFVALVNSAASIAREPLAADDGDNGVDEETRETARAFLRRCWDYADEDDAGSGEA